MIDLINMTLVDICEVVRLDASFKMIELVRYSLVRDGYTEVTKELFVDAFYNYFEQE